MKGKNQVPSKKRKLSQADRTDDQINTSSNQTVDDAQPKGKRLKVETPNQSDDSRSEDVANCSINPESENELTERSIYQDDNTDKKDSCLSEDKVVEVSEEGEKDQSGAEEAEECGEDAIEEPIEEPEVHITSSVDDNY